MLKQVREVEASTSIPLGLCQCGCGQPTRICNSTDKKRGRIKGQPFRYLQGHAPRRSHIKIEYDPEIGKGFCHCGCGGRTSMAPYTHASHGMIAGEPRLYIKGHHMRPRIPQYIVNDATECWEWQWFKDHKGYGRKKVGGRAIPAHVYFYEQQYGPVPDGLQLDHKCRCRSCVNPDHLEPVTCVENVRRSSLPKINVAIASQIKNDLKTMRPSDVAARHGVSVGIVQSIKYGKTWKDAA